MLNRRQSALSVFARHVNDSYRQITSRCCAVTGDTSSFQEAARSNKQRTCSGPSECNRARRLTRSSVLPTTKIGSFTGDLLYHKLQMYALLLHEQTNWRNSQNVLGHTHWLSRKPRPSRRSHEFRSWGKNQPISKKWHNFITSSTTTTVATLPANCCARRTLCEDYDQQRNQEVK